MNNTYPGCQLRFIPIFFIAVFFLNESSAEESNDPAMLPDGIITYLNEQASTINSIAFSADSKHLAIATTKSGILIYSVPKGLLKKELKGHEGSVKSVSFSPDGTLLASCGLDSKIVLWDPATGEVKRELTGHGDAVNNVKFSPDGSRLASASSDAGVIIWDVATGKEERTLSGHGAGIEGLDFSRDGRTILSEAGDVTARLWDAVSGKTIRILKQRDGEVASVALSPDGRLGISTQGDQTWHVFDVRTGNDILVLKGQDGNGTAAVFSNDSLSVFTGAMNGNIRQWDLFSGLVIRKFLGAYGRTRALALDPSGRMLATALTTKAHVRNLRSPPDLPITKEDKLKTSAPDQWEADWEKLGNPGYTIRTQTVLKFLAGDGKQMAFLLQKLQAINSNKKENIQDLLFALNDDKFGIREETSRKLMELGAEINPQIEKSLAQASPEGRERMLQLLFAAKPRRSIRQTLALEILWWHKSAEGRRALHELAKGPRNGPFTKQAQAILDR